MKLNKPVEKYYKISYNINKNGCDMKRILIILLCFVLFCLPAFADYKPIPKNLSSKYCEEITKTIDINYPITTKEIEQIASTSHKMYLEVYTNKVYYNRDLSSKYYSQNFEIHIDTPEFNLYKELLYITRKYVYLPDNEIPITDYSGGIYEFLLPYFKDNNINTTKLDKLGTLSAQTAAQIEKEQTQLNQLFDN